MPDDETTAPDPAPSRRWTPNLRAGRGGRSHQARYHPGTATIVISVACPTAGCRGRLRFGATGDDEGLTSECPTCRQPFVLAAGDVALRGASEASPREGAG
jgi:hypothetical protein